MLVQGLVTHFLPYSKVLNKGKARWVHRDSSWQQSRPFSLRRETSDLRCLWQTGTCGRDQFLHTVGMAAFTSSILRGTGSHLHFQALQSIFFSRCLFHLKEWNCCRRLHGSGDPGRWAQSLDCLHVQKCCFTQQSRGQWLSLDGQESGKAACALPLQNGLLSLLPRL